MLKTVKFTTLWYSWLINCATEYLVGRREKHSWWRVYSLQIDSNQPLSRFLLGLLCMSVRNSCKVLKFSALTSTKAFVIIGQGRQVASEWASTTVVRCLAVPSILQKYGWAIAYTAYPPLTPLLVFYCQGIYYLETDCHWTCIKTCIKILFCQ